MLVPLAGNGCAPSSQRAAAAILNAIARIPKLPDAVVRQSDREFRIGSRDGRFRSDAQTREARVNLVKSFAVAADAALTRIFPVPAAERNAHWRHAAEAAMITEALCEARNEPLPAADRYVAALLHDVGMLAISGCMPKSHARIRREADMRRIPLVVLEREHLGLDHAVIGGLIAGRWMLPDHVQAAIERHHLSADEPDGDSSSAALVRIIQLADMLSDQVSGGDSSRAPDDSIESLCHEIGVSADQARRAARIALDRPGGLITDLQAGLADRGDSCQSPGAATLHWNRSGMPEAIPADAVDADEPGSALVEFIADSARRESLADACGRIVLCVGSHWRIPAAVAYVFDRSARCFQCAALQEGELDFLTISVNEADMEYAGRFATAVAAKFRRTLIPPPSIARPVLERFDRLFAGESQLMLAIVTERELLGGVMFDAESADNSGICHSADQIALMSASITAAASNALRWNAAVSGKSESKFAAPNATQSRCGQTADAALMASLAELAAGAAHEMNSPLAVISGRAQTLSRLIENPIQCDALEHIRKHANLCSEIVDNLLVFAKPDRPRPALTALESRLSEIRAAWAVEFQRCGATFNIRLVDPAVAIMADPVQVETAIDAVLSNALAAMPAAGGCLEINSVSTRSDESVVIALRDNGCGMTREVLRRACDPFFSHRPAGRGRGMGLAMARRLVELNGGRLWIDSMPQRGTSVHIELPGATS